MSRFGPDNLFIVTAAGACEQVDIIERIEGEEHQKGLQQIFVNVRNLQVY
ncbi:MAG: hypothetical protein K9I74_04050 [Bacteroidales bacterium]|nr:hypothetical protein [Bacteroidales bacterium]